jgi:hypothetical protein
MEYAPTSHNRSVYAPLPSVAPGFRSPRSAAPSTAHFTHIFAVAGTLRVPLSQPQKRHIQPERYAKCPVDIFVKIVCIKIH